MNIYKKPVKGIHTETKDIVQFQSMNQAEEYGFDKARISNCIKDPSKHHKYYKWHLIDVDSQNVATLPPKTIMNNNGCRFELEYRGEKIIIDKLVDAKKYGLIPSKLSMVLNGTIEHHHGAKIKRIFV